MKISDPSLMVVDDEEIMQVLLVRLLAKAGYEHVITASSGDEALALLETEKVDLVLTDMQMPSGSGIDLLTHIHKARPRVATLMVTGVDDAELADQALALGAYGYIIKPFRRSEVIIGVSNALRRRELELENLEHRERLEETVNDRTAELWGTVIKLRNAEQSVISSRSETIARLAVAGEFRDEDTGLHVARMSRYCEILAREVGDEGLSESIREASSLHDVGKIGVPDSILLKPGPLTPDERKVMEEHAVIGHRILRESESPLLKLAAEIALTHHEKVDGTGYPNGLIGEAIPLAGRIAGIADVFDALTNDRVYRPAFSVDEAVEMMKKDAGTHFDSGLLATFWDALPKILAVEREYLSEDPLTPLPALVAPGVTDE